MRVIIAGGRDFEDKDALWAAAKNIGWKGNRRVVEEIVSGGARGADRLGEEFAQAHDIPVAEYPALWDTYGKRAGVIRNDLMAQNADVLVAFWDGQSRGTKNMIDTALSRGLEVHVYRY